MAENISKYKEKRVEQENKKSDIIFFSSPIHAKPDMQESVISLNKNEGEIPNGIKYIATYLQSKNVSSRVVPMDSFLKRENIKNEEDYQKAVEEILSKQINLQNPDIIAFELMYTLNSDAVIEMTRQAKKLYPDKPVVVGGNHATFSSEFLLNKENKTGIDIVVRNEGEWTMEELVRELKKEKPDLSKIKGISYRATDGKIINNDPRERGDLYKSPPIDYALLETPEGVDLTMFNHAVMFARACKGNCAFCTSPEMWKREITQSSIESFKAEIDYLIKNGVKRISIWDDDILVADDSFQKIVSALIESHQSNPDVYFFAQTRVANLRDQVNPEKKLELMKKAGIKKVFLGIESASQVILNAMKKGYKVEWIREACRNLKKHGIESGAFIIIGHPGSTFEEEEVSQKEIEELFKEKLIDDMQGHVLTPLPGTEVANDRRIKILNNDSRSYGLINNYPVFELINPETGEVTFSQEKIWESFMNLLKLRKQYLGLEYKESNKPRI